MQIDQVGKAISVPQAPIQKPVELDTHVSKAPIKKNKTIAQGQEEQRIEAQIADEKNVADQEHQVIKAIEKANKHIRTFDRKLEFSIHDQTKQIMVKVINTEDDSVIREIPSEKVLDMVAHLWEVAGLLIDEHR